MPESQKFEKRSQLVKRPWVQSNERRDTDNPVRRARKYSKKDQAEGFQKVAATQHTEPAVMKKNPGAASRLDKARKKPRGAYAQDNDSEIDAPGNGGAGSSSFQGAADAVPSTTSIVNDPAGTCIIVGYVDTESNPFCIDQPSIKCSPSDPKNDYSPTLLHARTPPNSPQIENSLTLPYGNMKGSLINHAATLKVFEVQSTIKKQGEGRGQCQNGIASTETVSTHILKQLPPHLRVVTRLPIDSCTPSGQPRNDNISGAASSVLRQLPIVKTTYSGPSVTGTGLGDLPNKMPPGLQPHLKRSTTFRKKISSIASYPETSSLGQTRNVLERSFWRASDHKSASGPRCDKMALEGSVTAQRLAEMGKILIPKCDECCIVVSIDPLMSQNAPGFFRFYSQAVGACNVSVLSFRLPDVTWHDPHTENISRDDSYAFEALKRTIWDCFCMFLTTGPRPAVFRVMVTASVQHMAGDTVSFLPSQAFGSNARASSSQRVVPRGFQPTLGLHPVQIVPAPQYCHSLVVSPALVSRQDKPVSETSSDLQIVVRIQENRQFQFSRPYSKNFLLSEVTTIDFFAWFACCTGCAYPLGPPELKFTWKNSLPESKHARIKRGDEEHFQNMKWDIKSDIEWTKALLPELTEFVILTTVPGWWLSN